MQIPDLDSMIDFAEANIGICKKCNNHYDVHWIIGIDRRRICPTTRIVNGMIMYRIDVSEQEYEDS